MTTFSQLVDVMVSETKRPDLVSEIATYLNQTIREVHQAQDNGGPILYGDNLHEKVLIATVATGFSWLIDEVDTFQVLQAVRYDSVFGDDCRPIYVEQRKPGRILNSLRYFWYRSGNYIQFAGYGGVDGQISLAWYAYPRRLSYYPANCRPATWTDDYQWSYHADWVATEEGREQAELMSSNWLLLRWTDVIMEGLRAKVYKRVGDKDRANLCYSLFSQLRMGIQGINLANPGGIY